MGRSKWYLKSSLCKSKIKRKKEEDCSTTETDATITATATNSDATADEVFRAAFLQSISAAAAFDLGTELEFLFHVSDKQRR